MSVSFPWFILFQPEQPTKDKWMGIKKKIKKKKKSDQFHKLFQHIQTSFIPLIFFYQSWIGLSRYWTKSRLPCECPYRCLVSRLIIRFGIWTWERWQWRSTLHFPKLQHYWNLAIRLFSVISKKHVGENLTPLQSSSRCILQPKPTRQQFEHLVGPEMSTFYT